MAYHNLYIDGLSIFYRETGPKDAPALLLLHGFPSSSRMYEPLLMRLANSYHLVAPDYPGFGHSDAPDPKLFDYTFDRLAEVIDKFTELLGLTRYSLFVQDYGGPVGFRLAVAHPERIQSIIVQNAVAHEDGLGPLWDVRKAFWADRQSHEAELRENFLSLEAARHRHVGSSPCASEYDPDLWIGRVRFSKPPGPIRHPIRPLFRLSHQRRELSEVAKWMRQHRPPLAVIWGRYDPSFLIAEAEAYRRDVPGRGSACAGRGALCAGRKG